MKAGKLSKYRTFEELKSSVADLDSPNNEMRKEFEDFISSLQKNKKTMKIENTRNCFVCGSEVKREGSSLHCWDIEYECGCRIFGAIDEETHGNEVEVGKECENKSKPVHLSGELDIKEIPEEELDKERNSVYKPFNTRKGTRKLTIKKISSEIIDKLYEQKGFESWWNELGDNENEIIQNSIEEIIKERITKLSGISEEEITEEARFRSKNEGVQYADGFYEGVEWFIEKLKNKQELVSKSEEIIEQVAIEFAEWSSDIKGTLEYYDPACTRLYRKRGKELFQEFLKTKQ